MRQGRWPTPLGAAHGTLTPAKRYHRGGGGAHPAPGRTTATPTLSPHLPCIMPLPQSLWGKRSHHITCTQAAKAEATGRTERGDQDQGTYTHIRAPQLHGPQANIHT